MEVWRWRWGIVFHLAAAPPFSVCVAPLAACSLAPPPPYFHPPWYPPVTQPVQLTLAIAADSLIILFTYHYYLIYCPPGGSTFSSIRLSTRGSTYVASDWLNLYTTNSFILWFSSPLSRPDCRLPQLIRDSHCCHDSRQIYDSYWFHATVLSFQMVRLKPHCFLKY